MESQSYTDKQNSLNQEITSIEKKRRIAFTTLHLTEECINKKYFCERSNRTQNYILVFVIPYRYKIDEMQIIIIIKHITYSKT